MFVETCSLGCSSGQGGAAVNCTIDAIKQNQEIAIVFSQAVDINSVNSSTFQIQNVSTGSVPLGSFQVDPSNPRRLVFRPALTFDSLGQLQLGFTAGETYRVTIPGTENDAGPYIQSTSGKRNRSRLRCDVQPNGIADAVPGRPRVEVFVDVQLFDGMGMPAGMLLDQPADGQTDVAQLSPIRMVFKDIMNPLTLANPDNTSNFIEVNIDRDGNPATLSDQSPLAGEFFVDFNEAEFETVLTFIPTCIPGPGITGRQILVVFQTGVADLAGNELISPGVINFTAEDATSGDVVLPDGPEDFSTTANFDSSRSGANMWTGDGQLVPGFGGGSGRLGVLRVRDGETFVLNTDLQSFPAATFPAPGIESDIISNLVPGDYDALVPGSWPRIDVSDGVFEFSKIDVETGGTLLVQGDQPAVLLSRGSVRVNGRIDATGEAGVMQLAQLPTSDSAGGGPNGGDGGVGGTRYNATRFFSGGAVQGPARPINLTCDEGPDVMCPVGTVVPATGDTCCLGIPEAMDGQPGEEVGQGIAPSDGPPPTGSNGVGGVHWPNVYPVSAGQGAGWRDLIVDDSAPTSNCRSLQVGGPGGGGGYALDGGAGVPVTLPEADGNFNPVNVPPSNTAGGSAVGLEPANPQGDHYIRKLSPERGFLRGGSGGGGGGTNLYNTGTQNPASVIACNLQNIYVFFDNSGAPGGGGGGGVMLTSGSTLTVNGQIDASGGDGGSATSLPPSETENLDRRNVTPGGGGSGGSIRLQAVDLEIRDNPNRLDVRGGAGGTGVAGSTGGAGSRGLVRLEQPAASQSDPGLMISRESERESIQPYDETDPADSELHLSVGRWAAPRTRKEAMTGATSCWMQAEVTGCFFELAFAEDDDQGTPDPADDTFGWNMTVIYDSSTDPGNPNPQEFPYRGIPSDPNFPLLDSIENTLGNMLGVDLPVGQGSALVVRFQGAQSKALQLTNRCDTELTGPNAEIVAGSLTPWVSHPAELNEFVPVPNMIRFTILFDRSLAIPGTVNDFIKGITELRIDAIPN